jgi:hypothetical protein
LSPNIDIGKSSVEVILERLDVKTTGAFYDKYIAIASDATDSSN